MSYKAFRSDITLLRYSKDSLSKKRIGQLGHYSKTLTDSIFWHNFFDNLGGLLYNGRIQRAYLDCSKESKYIDSQSACAIQSLY
jgi:hypothetical protein